jgi:hypothetical protein
VDPVPNPLLLRKSGSARNRTRTSGSVARNSEDYTTEAVSRSVIECEKSWEKRETPFVGREKEHLICYEVPSFRPLILIIRIE